MKNKLYLLFTVFILILAGCQNNQTEKVGKESKKEKLDVFTTVYPLEYITKQIGGNSVDVKSIYPPGADEHTYEPTQKDMMKLADSDLFLYIGLGLEGFVEKSESILKNEHVTMVAAGENLPIMDLNEDEHAHTEADHSHEEEAGEHEHVDGSDEEHEHEENENDDHDHHDHGDIDPHVWMDPKLMKELAMNVLGAMTEKMPDQKQTFEKNYQDLVKELDEIDLQISEVAEKAKRKKIIVPHAAYGYWELRYGIEQIAISGISSTSEPTQKKLQSIIDTIKQEEVPYILYEQNIQSKLADVVLEETGVKALHIHNLAVLTEDDLKNQDDYITLMKRNIEVLEKALN